LLEFWWQASLQYYAWTTTRPAANHLPHREKELQEKKWCENRYTLVHESMVTE
jgi:hypothetical protein